MPRQMRCPKCKTVNTVEDGAKPVCSNCGFGSAAPAPGSTDAKFTRAGATPAQPEGPPPRSASLIAGIVTFGIALALLGLVQFPLLSWIDGNVTDAPAGTVQYNLWGVDYAEKPDWSTCTDGSTSASYWDEACSQVSTASGRVDMEGLSLIRWAGPASALALALGLTAAIAAFLRKSLLTNITGWAAASVAASAIVLFALGHRQLQDQYASLATANATFDWGVSFYLAIVGVLALAIATTLGPPKPKAEAPPSASQA
jgi:hypothetical protein